MLRIAALDRIYKKLSYRRETASKLRTSFSARSLIVHVTEHRIRVLFNGNCSLTRIIRALGLLCDVFMERHWTVSVFVWTCILLLQH